MESLDLKWIRLMEIGHYTGCHQMPERSFFVFGYQFPICARCTGLLIGELFAYILALFKIIFSPLISIIMLSIMGADWGLQYLGIKESNNYRRLFSGIFGGLGTTFIFIHMVSSVLCTMTAFFKNA